VKGGLSLRLTLLVLFFAVLSRPVPASEADHTASALHLIPQPRSVKIVPNCTVRASSVLALLDHAHLDAGGLELLRVRWSALGVGGAAKPAPAGPLPTLRPEPLASLAPPASAETYTLDVDARGVSLGNHNAEGQFDALVTLAQLATRRGNVWEVPCVHIVDFPALPWRILSDDVSRGPLPTMRYFKERIRTIASFKYNGYSPYMEHVFVDPKHPLPAPLDGITPQQLHDLAVYAARYHVAFIPEQQTFAHMHETLRWERYAPLAETPHGYLLAPANPAGEAYVRDLITDELAAVPRPPFFHIGSDEPADLGLGRSKELVATQGEGAVYARHVIDTANFVLAHGGAIPLIWDDALARHPELFGSLPKQLMFVNWHYGLEPTYRPYIDRIARGGFRQMVAPGALNWNEIYPDIDDALGAIDRFVTEGKAAHVEGLFQTVWHDDGETLFEATWYPILYAAASAWEQGSVDRARYARDFPSAFFGTDDARYADDLASLARCNALLHGNPRDYGDYLFWDDPFLPELANVPSVMDLPALRLSAENAIAHLRLAAPPPLHANAASVMFLAARRYDALGREYQIPQEAREYYNAAAANAKAHAGSVYRGLYLARYLLWEQRDTMMSLEPLVRAAWEYENRPSHEASVLERYRVAADRAITRADRLGDVTFGDYAQKKTLPSFNAALGIGALP